MNERLKELRKLLDLSQEELGNRLGLSRSAISNMESGRYNITDSLVKLICTEFDVNEYWLRTGTGEIFLQTSLDALSEITKQFDLDEMDKQIVLQYLNLNEFERKVIKDYIAKIVNGMEGKK